MFLKNRHRIWGVLVGHVHIHTYNMYVYLPVHTYIQWALSDFRAEFLVFTILILIIWGCSPKSPLFEYKIDIILRNRHWHRFRTFIVVYFIFCFRKKIFFQSYNIQYRFFLETFFTVFWFFSKWTPNIPPRGDLVAQIEYFTDCHESRLKSCCIFCATFRTKLCNTRFRRQDLLGGMVDSKMLLFYCSQIGQCSVQKM